MKQFGNRYEGGLRDSDVMTSFTGVASEADVITEEQLYVRVTAPASGESIITLPMPELCEGKTFHIKCVGGNGTVTLQQGDAVSTDISLTDGSNALASGEEVVLRSVFDGWVVLKDTTS